MQYDERMCHMCTSQVPGNEEHILLQCSGFAAVRSQYHMLDFSHYMTLPTFLQQHRYVADLYAYIAAVMREVEANPWQPP